MLLYVTLVVASSTPDCTQGMYKSCILLYIALPARDTQSPAHAAKCDQEASHCLPETDVKPFACVHFLLSSTAPQEMGPDDVLDKSGSCVASGEELVLMQSGLSEKGHNTN